MRFRSVGGKIILLAASLAIGTSFSDSSAHAANVRNSPVSNITTRAGAEFPGLARTRQANRLPIQYSGVMFPGRVIRDTRWHGQAMRSYADRRPTLQCVAFARAVTNIALSGNAANWWDNAAGVYNRGQRPVPNSVLAFTANGRMPLGHVAVVSRIVNGREIEIDHANWAGAGAHVGGVARGVAVVDVSERNDWTAVRVTVGQTGDFGSVYPTYGFIYDQADTGTRVASVAIPAPALTLNPAPADLRTVAFNRAPQVGQTVSYDEVAEAPRFGVAVWNGPRRSRAHHHQ